MKYRDSALVDGLQLVALSGLALAAPQLDVLGRNPGFLVAHRATPAEIAALVATLLLAPPLALWGMLRIANRIDPRLGTGLRATLMGVLTALFCLPAVGRLPGLPGAAAVALAVALGAGAGFSFARRRGVRLFVACLAPLPLVVAVHFFLRPDVTRLLQTSGPAEAAADSAAADTPVVLVIFDELPTTSLLDENGRIDADRYPSFAGLAEHATWFRNATTVAASTSLALPAILTGSYPGPETLATAADHPHNLFTLLGDWDMHVHESRSFLFTGDADRGGTASDGPDEGRLRFAWDLTVLTLHALLPADIEAGLPDVTHTWKHFDGPDPTAEKRWKGEQFVDRGATARKFIDGVDACAGGCLNFLHLMLPHFPWQYDESGRKYLPHGAPELHGDVWGTSSWYVLQGYQRHLIQLAFVDRILGDLLARLKAVDLYDRALVIVAADHGAAFWPEQSRRQLQRTEHPEEILRIPLLVKRPEQRTARIDDRAAAVIDIVPTVAAVLGIDPPWELDGCALTEPACPGERGLVAYGGADGRRERLDYSPAILQRSVGLRRKLHLFGTGPGTGGLFEIGAYKALVGRPVAELEIVGELEVSVELSDESLVAFQRRPDEFGLTRVIGRFPSPERPDRAVQIAVARDGIVRAVVPAFAQGAGLSSFSAMLPIGGPGAASERLELFAVLGPPAGPQLLRARHAFSDFDTPYRRPPASPARGGRRMR